MHGYVNVFVAVATSTLCACMPVGVDYKYIHVESPQFSVTELGRSSLVSQVLYFRGHSEMPTVYVLARDEYIVRGEIPLDAYRAEMIFSATTPDGHPLSIGGQVFDECYGAFVNNRFEETGFAIPQPSIRYYWIGRSLAKCRERPEPIGERLDAEVGIFDDNGLLLGEEVIFFTVQVNGRYYQWDGP